MERQNTTYESVRGFNYQPSWGSCGLETFGPDFGFLAHLLHHTLVADGHRPEYGPISEAGYMAFIEAEGSLRPHHEVFNEF